MIIQKVNLRHFCQHIQEEFTLSPGLNMIVGPNGSGKTNLLRATQFLVTGDSGGNRPKADDVYQGVFGSNEESFVSGQLLHEGTVITLKRALQPATANLMEIGDETWTSVNAINSELFRRLGTTKKQIHDYIFVRQRGIDEMFDQKPAERAASLASLFGLDKAEKIWKQTGDFLKTIEVPTTTLSLDELNAQHADIQVQITELNNQFAALHLPLDGDAKLAEHQTVIDGCKQREMLMNKQAVLEKTREETLASAKAAMSYRQQLQTEATLLENAMAAVSVEANDAHGELARWDAYDKSLTAREQFVADELAFRTKWPSHPKQPREVAPLGEDLVEALKGYRAVRNSLTNSIKGLEDEDDNCPTCGQPLPEADQATARLQELHDQLRECEMERQPLEEQQRAYDQYCAELLHWQRQCEEMDKEQEALEQRKEALQLVEQPRSARDALQAVIDEHTEFCAAHKEIQEKLKVALATEASLDAKLDQQNQTHFEQTAEIDSLHKYTAEAATIARQELQQLKGRLAQATELDKQIAVLRATLDGVESKIDDVRRVEQKSIRTRQAVDHLQRIRDMYHRNEAPRLVSYTYIENMLDEVNRTLELFEAPFRVEMDEDLGFICRFTDGIRVQPDSRLSVGERIVLAMAFRITVNSTFAGQVGVLILDEPTAGLDEHNLGCLPHALERLQVLSAERGLQVLFVTHEPRIQHLFDNVITLRAHEN